MNITADVRLGCWFLYLRPYGVADLRGTLLIPRVVDGADDPAVSRVWRAFDF